LAQVVADEGAADFLQARKIQTKDPALPDEALQELLDHLALRAEEFVTAVVIRHMSPFVARRGPFRGEGRKTSGGSLTRFRVVPGSLSERMLKTCGRWLPEPQLLQRLGHQGAPEERFQLAGRGKGPHPAAGLLREPAEALFEDSEEHLPHSLDL